MIHHNQIVIEGVVIERPEGKPLIIVETYMAGERTMLVWVDTSKVLTGANEGESVIVVGSIDFQDDSPDSMIVRATTIITCPTEAKNNVESWARLLEDA